MQQLLSPSKQDLRVANASSPGLLLDQAEADHDSPHRRIELCTQALKHSREEIGEYNFCRAHYLLGYANRFIGEMRSAESELSFAKQLSAHIDAKEINAKSTMQLALLC